jgi:hypothetical protein
MNAFRDNANAPKKNQEVHTSWSHRCTGTRNKFPHLPLLFSFCNICTILIINYIRLLCIFCLPGNKGHRCLRFINHSNVFKLIPVTAQSKPWVCGRSLPGIAGLNPAGGHESFVSLECCVLTGRGLWDGLITRTEEFYRV